MCCHGYCSQLAAVVLCGKCSWIQWQLRRPTTAKRTNKLPCKNKNTRLFLCFFFFFNCGSVLNHQQQVVGSIPWQRDQSPAAFGWFYLKKKKKRKILIRNIRKRLFKYCQQKKKKSSASQRVSQWSQRWWCHSGDDVTEKHAHKLQSEENWRRRKTWCKILETC